MEQQEKEREKRKRDDEKDSDRAAKRRVRDGAHLKAFDFGESITHEFADMLYRTDDVVSLPLSFFTNSALQY